MLGIGTVQTNRLSGCTFKNKKDMKKSDRVTYDTKIDTTNKVVATKWYDNKFVRVVSNYKSIHPLDKVERWSNCLIIGRDPVKYLGRLKYLVANRPVGVRSNTPNKLIFTFNNS